tara:strand:- start:84 stop:239 length:156 start_codon:yes stop_codon:yes gene_type:complete
MKDRQCSDKANQGRSGGVNNQTGTLSAEIMYAASSAAATVIPAKGTSNGGK